jgi:hypothetical protein
MPTCQEVDQPKYIQDSQREDWVESEFPLTVTGMHILAQIDDKGLFKNANQSETFFSLFSDKKLVPFHVSISVSDILNIDPVNESFSVKYRLFMMWREDLHEVGLSSLSGKATECGHYYPLKRNEVENFLEHIHVPKLALFNNMSITETDAMDVRIYGGEKGKTAILVNQGFNAVIRERFILNNFPFDLQILQFDFRLHDARSWNRFQLIIDNVQFHRDCLEQMEWRISTPFVKKGYMKTFNSVVSIPVIRKSKYFVQNIFLIIIVLTLLGLCTFSFESRDLAGRTFVNLTLILTMIAFKFTALSGSIPKVPYSTIMDFFINCALWNLTVMTAFTIIPNFYINEETHYDETLNKALAIISIGLIVIGFGTISLVAYQIRASHLTKYALIPIEKSYDRPWYSFRFTNSRHLVDLTDELSKKHV